MSDGRRWWDWRPGHPKRASAARRRQADDEADADRGAGTAASGIDRPAGGATLPNGPPAPPTPVAGPDALLAIERVHVPAHAVAAVDAHFRAMGRRQVEGVAFWAGELLGRTFRVREAVVPPQRAGRLHDGLAVVIDGDALFQLNVWLHRRRLQLVAQLHSHPGAAYHSNTDEDWAVLSRAGGLSIVVPDFARAPFSLDTAAVYRLTRDGQWAALSPAAARALIRIEDDEI